MELTNAPNRPHPVDMAVHGTEHHKAALDWEKVRYIREHDELSNEDLARMFGVARSTIRMVRANVTWKDPSYTPRPSEFWGAGVKSGVDRRTLEQRRAETLGADG